jgi:hypothetical protein
MSGFQPVQLPRAATRASIAFSSWSAVGLSLGLAAQHCGSNRRQQFIMHMMYGRRTVCQVQLLFKSEQHTAAEHYCMQNCWSAKPLAGSLEPANCLQGTHSVSGYNWLFNA